MDRTKTMSEMEKHFTEIYNTNYWNGKQSKSGTGSDLETTNIMRPQLVELINSMGFKSMIDAPCGDFNWMSKIVDKIQVSRYVGMDIVQEMIDNNNREYGNDARIQFKKIDVINEILPKVSLIFSRDCLVHFSYETAKKILRNFIDSGSDYVLMTTFQRDDRNYPDILDGQWRAINFSIKPFCLPEPERIIVEGCTEDNYRWTDKCLALWKLSELKGLV